MLPFPFENGEIMVVPENSQENVDLDTLEETPLEEKLDLKVEIDEVSACQRHVTVTIDEKSIEQYFDKEYDDLVPQAQVPGFRPGRAPRKLVEKRFRKDVGERVKSNLVLDALTQVNEENELTPISEPDFDFDSIVLPEDGPLIFEFDLEVRPEFELPDWEGLKIEKPTHEFTDEEVDRAVERVLANHGQLAPSDEPAEPGDYVVTRLTFKDGEQVISSAEEETIRIRPLLSFHDGVIENFDELMKGAKPGDVVKTNVPLSEDAPNVALRGKTVDAIFEIQEIKRLDLPELDEEFLQQLGGFESEADLRDAVQDNLRRQLEHEQRQRARRQVTEALTESADWELPPALLEKQSRRELQRAILELRRSGYPEDQILSHMNTLRRSSQASTAQALKEHFILEKIAEEENIEDEPMDYDMEIALIASQSGATPRRVRAQLEKSGEMDILRNQIIERKVIDRILEKAKFQEVPFEMPGITDEAMDRAVTTEQESDESDIAEVSEEDAKAAAREEAEGEHS